MCSFSCLESACGPLGCPNYVQEIGRCRAPPNLLTHTCNGRGNSHYPCEKGLEACVTAVSGRAQRSHPAGLPRRGTLPLAGVRRSCAPIDRLSSRGTQKRRERASPGNGSRGRPPGGIDSTQVHLSERSKYAQTPRSPYQPDGPAKGRVLIKSIIFDCA